MTIPMAPNVYIGYALTSHDYGNSASATFDTTCDTGFVELELYPDNLINFKDWDALVDKWGEEVLWPTD